MLEYLRFAHELADKTAELTRDGWRGAFEVSYKSDGSSLTEIDLAVEKIWRSEIRKTFPEHGILGEEFGQEPGRSAFTWVLDPIDGTRQFGTGLLDFSSLISLCRDGVPVLGLMDMPLVGARFSALQGHGTYFNTRRVQSAGQRDLAQAVIGLSNHDSFTGDSLRVYETFRPLGRVRAFDGGSPAYGSLARGLIDVCVNGPDLDAFDISALCPIVQEAGGVITDWQGGALSIESSGGIIASASAELHDAVLQTVRQATASSAVTSPAL